MDRPLLVGLPGGVQRSNAADRDSEVWGDLADLAERWAYEPVSPGVRQMLVAIDGASSRALELRPRRLRSPSQVGSP